MVHLCRERLYHLLIKSRQQKPSARAGRKTDGAPTESLAARISTKDIRYQVLRVCRIRQDFVREEIFESGSAEIDQDQMTTHIFNRANESSFAGQDHSSLL